jgi:hypothetical protein
VKSLLKRDGPRTPTAIHGSSDLKLYPSGKANAISDCLEIQFSPHELCAENLKRQVEAAVQALHETVYNSPPIRIRSCDLQELIKACGTDDIPNECLRHLPKRPLVHLTQSLPSAIALPKSLEGIKNDNFAKTRRRSEIPTKFTSDYSPVHDGQTIRKSNFKITPKTY